MWSLKTFQGIALRVISRPDRGQEAPWVPVYPAVLRARVPFLPPTPFCISLSWGRWKDILTHGRFKWHLNEKDMEMICRALLVYCVKHYKGDEKIKSFIWELITPTKDGQAQTLQNHSGERWQGCVCWRELLWAPIPPPVLPQVTVLCRLLFLRCTGEC